MGTVFLCDAFHAAGGLESSSFLATHESVEDSALAVAEGADDYEALACHT